MQIESRSVGRMDNNAYLLSEADRLVLVDAAADAPALLAWIGDRPLDAIVTTHRHADHIGALAEVAQSTGARLLCSARDAEAVSRATGLAQEPVWTGDFVTLGKTQLEVIGLVGHTPGGIALAHRPGDGHATVLTGDCLFPGGVGATPTPEAFRTLLDGVVRSIFDRFDDDTVILPGHGQPTTVGAERPHLAEWRERAW